MNVAFKNNISKRNFSPEYPIFCNKNIKMLNIQHHSVAECGIYGYSIHDNSDIYSAKHIHNYVNPANDSLNSDTIYFVH